MQDLLEDEARPVFSRPWPRCWGLLAVGGTSTTIPTALLGSEGRDRAGDVDR